MPFKGGTYEERLPWGRFYLRSCCACGIIDSHPGDKATRRNLSQQVTKYEAELANLQTEYNQKLKAYRSVEDSFVIKIEEAIMASDPNRYIVNAVKKLATTKEVQRETASQGKRTAFIARRSERTRNKRDV